MASITELIKKRVENYEGITHYDEDPKSNRFNFMSSEEITNEQALDEYRVWYVGDSNELLNHYLNMEAGGNAKNPIYNRNKKQYFWALSEKECNVKRVHSGIPRSAIQTIVNMLGEVKFKSDNFQERIDRIVESNNLSTILNQQSRPLTLAEGYGAYKVTFDSEVSDQPVIEYYEAKDVVFILKRQKVFGIIYKDYYKYNGKDYILLETRRTDNVNSYIEFELFRYNNKNEATQVPLSTIPELSNLPVDGYVFSNIKRPLGEPSRYFFDINNKNYGQSVLAGKIDICDGIDMLLTVEEMTHKNSSPMEYYPVDLLKRTKNGRPSMPAVFGRTYVKKPTTPNADGTEDGKIDISAPVLNFQQYSDALIHKIEVFLSGILSPATFGIDVSRKDNALAQREKEKVSIFTGQNIIGNERPILKHLMEDCLMLQEYMITGAISSDIQYDISIIYDELCNPSFESTLESLLPAYVQGGMSTNMFVEKLYGGNLTDEEKALEIQRLEEAKKQDNINLGEFGLEDDKFENRDFQDSGNEEQAQEGLEESQE